ncbi:uncharacterized protein YukE [Microbacterium sp. W4I4]|uniref:hypothetical protein n=1 Tax=Microbacterium sp. W4I4 TaxID=3042295 RepID=UPI00277DB296|nr:hypothetical protein [Microbacterium sp. W4I4]MDQ0613466.1 uncharacterized protein YukE [Microbacterium sp. W4I4]
MTDGLLYNPAMPNELGRRWDSQAAQMTTLGKEISAASTAGLPAVARGAARTFLSAWEEIALEAKVASEVYADELRSTGRSYEDVDAEIARRMAALKGDPQ